MDRQSRSKVSVILNKVVSESQTKLVVFELNPEGDKRVNKDSWQYFPGTWNGK